MKRILFSVLSVFALACAGSAVDLVKDGASVSEIVIAEKAMPLNGDITGNSVITSGISQWTYANVIWKNIPTRNSLFSHIPAPDVLRQTLKKSLTT